MITTRPSKDLCLIGALDRACFPHDEPYDIQSAHWWVMRKNGTVAGYCGAKIIPSADAVYMCRAGILPQFRGRGYQQRLIEARVRWGRGAGVGMMITDTAPHNVASINNLISAGFRRYAPEDEWQGEDWCYWRLAL